MAIIPINIKTGDVDGEQIQKKELVVGIDLGTTNSLVAYIKDGKPIAVTEQNGKNTLMPSVIYFEKNGKILVGDAAKEKLVSDPENTIYSVKRLMGKSYKDVRKTSNALGYKIIDSDTESLVKIQVRDKFYTPVELSALILKELKSRIELNLEQEVSKSVITVPAYFNDAQRQATRDAGKLAGWDVLRIVNEPTAASLAYGLDTDSKESEIIAVYDLGGGTFDVSILQLEDGIFEVLSTNGDTFLGGDDFDALIVEFWKTQEPKIEELAAENQNIFSELRLAAESAKKNLSFSDTFSKNLDVNGVSILLNLSKIEFENLLLPLIKKSLSCCAQALSDAKLSASQIQKVVMVGGSTRIPLVKKSVSQFFNQTVFDELNPDEVVALGAAVQADILSGNRNDLLLIDITPLSLGIETVGGLMDVIIPRNNKIPSKAGRQYTTSVDGQKNLKIAVFQGERDMVQFNRKLGEFILSDIPAMPAGMPKIDIQFILDADGILTVRAKELRSDTAQSIKIKSAYGISEEEMALMLIDSIQNAAADRDQRALLEAKNEANNILLSSEKFIIQNLNILTAEEVLNLKNYIAKLKLAVQKEEKNTINGAMEALNIYSTPLAHRALDANIAEAIKGKSL